MQVPSEPRRTNGDTEIAEQLQPLLAQIAERALDAGDPKTALRAAEKAKIELSWSRLAAAGDTARARGAVNQAICGYRAAHAVQQLIDYGASMLQERDRLTAERIWREGEVTPPRDVLRAYAESALLVGNVDAAKWAHKLIGEPLPLALLITCGDKLEGNPDAAIACYAAARAYKRIRHILDRAMERDQVHTAVNAYHQLRHHLSRARHLAYTEWLLAHNCLDAALEVCPSLPTAAFSAYVERARCREDFLYIADTLSNIGLPVPQEWIRERCIAELRRGVPAERVIHQVCISEGTLTALAEELLVLGRPKEALAAYGYRSCETTSEEYLAVGQCALRIHDLERAVAAYEEAGAEIPLAALTEIATALLAQENYKDAFIACQILLDRQDAP